MNSIEYTLEAGRVQRFHNTPIDRKQTVGEHSWGVAVLVIYLTRGEASASLLKAAILHDCAEVTIGDIPAPTKWSTPNINSLLHMLEEQVNLENGWHVELKEEERLVLKWADVLEGVAYCNDRIQAGDRRAITIRDRWVEYARQLPYHEIGLTLLETWSTV